MQKVKIIADSSCDLPKELLEKHNVDLAPMCIHFDEKEYLDYFEVDQKFFLEKFAETGNIPKTSLPRRDIMKKYFTDAIDKYESIIYITISSKASGSFNLARILIDDIEEETGKRPNITVIDSMTFSLSIGRVVYKSALMAEEGATGEEIVDYVNSTLKRSGIRFIVSDLVYLKKGGRIKPGAAMIASVLGIIPILTADEGLIVPIAKERGMKRAISHVLDDIKNDMSPELANEIMIVHCNALENATILAEQLKSEYNLDHVVIYETYGTISTHAGPGVCAVFYLK